MENLKKEDQLLENWRKQGEAIKSKWGLEFADTTANGNVSEQLQHLQELRHEYYFVLQLSEQEVELLEFINNLKESFLRLHTLKTNDPTGNLNDGAIA